jgi:hypothetical protein
MLEGTYSTGRKGILATPQNPLVIIESHKKQRGYGVLSPAGNLLYHQQLSWFFTQSVFLYGVIILSNNYQLSLTVGLFVVLT